MEITSTWQNCPRAVFAICSVVICKRGELCKQQASHTSFCERGELATACEQLQGHRIQKTRGKRSESMEVKVLILLAACLCAALRAHVLGSCQKKVTYDCSNRNPYFAFWREDADGRKID